MSVWGLGQAAGSRLHWGVQVGCGGSLAVVRAWARRASGGAAQGRAVPREGASRKQMPRFRRGRIGTDS